ncbi:MAG: peptidylprolyl isomerase [Alphaproteobacteria bacterium]|nr:peptidylprolyl isomerase [Alphaproteobacteria bacterium]
MTLFLKRTAACLLCAFVWSIPVNAGEIKAVVGDTPISSYDIKQRIKLIKLQMPSVVKEKSDKAMEQLALNVLVDELVKRQSAMKQGFTVTDADILNAIGRLEKQNNMSAGEMMQALKEKGIDANTLHNQVGSDLLWLKVIEKNKASLSPVKPAEIQAEKNKMIKKLAEPRYLLAEIVVPTKNQADKIVADIQSGALFSEVAKNQSTAKSAEQDGLIGWVDTQHYPSAVMAQVSKLFPNNMTKPIQTDNGWIIVFMLDKQEGVKNGSITVWDLAQMAISTQKTVSLLPTILGVDTCDAFQKLADMHAIDGSVQRGMVNPTQLPPELKEELKKQTNAMPIGPIQTPAGDMFFMKCGQKTQSLLPTDDVVQSALEMDKMEELSNKLLRQEKRYAVIEYK